MFAILSISMAAIAFAGLVVVWFMLRSYRRNQRIIMGSRGTVDVAEHMAIVDDKLTNIRLAVEDLTLTARDHGVRIDGTLSHVGIVRFDAYRDLGGRQSTAVALVNSRGDGTVITTVVSRDFARMYVKLVRDGVGDIPLAPEENEALQQARRATPFVVKPAGDATEGTEAEGEEGDGDMFSYGSDTTMVASLPGPLADEELEALERENRRRQRKGLAPMLTGDAMASTQGWDAPETLGAASTSMAERFLEERRKSMRDDAETFDDEEPDAFDDSEEAEWSDPEDEDPEGTFQDDEWGFELPPDDDTHEL